MEADRATIHLVPHFHYDPVWVEDQRTYTRRAFDLVGQYLGACREDDGYRVMLSEVDYLKPFLAVHSEEREFVRELVANGRLRTGGAYGEPNEMSIQGEALIRNLLHGWHYHEGLLGAGPSVYLPLDVFGHCVQLPQLAAKAGFQAIVWSKDIVGAPPLCYALAPDGRALLQKHEHYWYQPESLEELLNTVAEGLEKQAALGLYHDLRLLGGDMSPPPAWLTGRSQELAQRDPAILISTPDGYLAGVKPEAQMRAASIPLVGRDLSWYHMGTAVSRADLKIANRLAENRLLNAEKWATLAAMVGARYPDLALDKAWRQVLFGQHHDAITGTSSDVPYLDLLAGYREALELAGEVETRSLSYLLGRINSRGERGASRAVASLVVFNPLGWERTDVCKARIQTGEALASGFELVNARGRPVPFQVTARSREAEQAWVEIAFIATGVPSVGYQTYYLRPARGRAEMPQAREVEEATIEDERFSVRAEATAGGGITSIFDKQAKREVLNPRAGPANEVVALGERPDREMAPWELFTTGEIARSSGRRARLSVVEGPVFSQARAVGEGPGKCVLHQEVTVYRGLGRIDLRTVVERYGGEHELFAVTFPLAAERRTATFEDRFATVVKRASRGKLDFRTLNEKNLSRCGLGSAQNWVDVGPVPSLWITDRGARVRAVEMGPCSIITSANLRERAAVRALEVALLRRGVTCTPWVDSENPEQEAGACAFRISLGMRNSYAERVLAAEPEARARLSRTLREGGWAGVLVNRPDPRGEEPATPVLVVDTADERGIPWVAEAMARLIEGDRLEIPDTWDFSRSAGKPDDYGVALVNRGTLAASLENDGTLVELLFHTAPWSTHAWGEGKLERFLVPEQKSHVFEHALVPHQGDWRSGGVVRAAYEVNNPLRSMQAPLQEGLLPPELSLVAVDASNVVITAVKPVGNPVADHRATELSDPDRGILVRLYEAEGRATTAQLSFAARPEEAWLADLLERKSGEASVVRPGWRREPVVSVETPACGVVTVVSRLAPLAETSDTQEVGPTVEPYSPVYCRYWDHNLGAAPMGNQPLSLWLRGELEIGQTTRFGLGISNDAREREITGAAEVLAPEAWTLIPRRVPYRIAAGSHAVYEIMVVVPPEAKPCFLRAVIQDGNQVLQDVLPIGEVSALEASLEREGDGFALSVRNPNADYVEGQVTLVVPLEWWGEAAGSFSLGAVEPRCHAFRLEAGETQRFAFALSGDREAPWAVGKVMWYGRVLYVQERS